MSVERITLDEAERELVKRLMIDFLDAHITGTYTSLEISVAVGHHHKGCGLMLGDLLRAGSVECGNPKGGTKRRFRSIIPMPKPKEDLSCFEEKVEIVEIEDTPKMLPYGASVFSNVAPVSYPETALKRFHMYAEDGDFLGYSDDVSLAKQLADDLSTKSGKRVHIYRAYGIVSPPDGKPTLEIL